MITKGYEQKVHLCGRGGEKLDMTWVLDPLLVHFTTIEPQSCSSYFGQNCDHFTHFKKLPQVKSPSKPKSLEIYEIRSTMRNYIELIR